jgi:putative ABC transport system permease protein
VLRVTLKNLMARKFRLVLTSIAVMLGVAFMAGTLVLTDTMSSVFDDLFANVDNSVDAAVQSKPALDSGSGPGTQTLREPVDASVLDLVKTVPEVRDAQGGVGGIATVVKLDRGKPGDVVKHGQAPQLGTSWGPNPRLSGAFQDVSGHRPTAPNEVALDEVTAEDAGITRHAAAACADASRKLDGDPKALQALKCNGARVQMTFNQHEPQLFNVVAVFRFGTAGNLAGATLAAFDTPTAQELLNRVGKFDLIRIEATSGVSPVELRDAVRATLSAHGMKGLEVLTGTQLANDQSSDIKDQLSFLSTFLLVFAIVALFVGAFIIYNTFSIIVAQRTRELGLMRALGASGRQVVGSVAAEALVVGLLSSLLGLALGIGVAIGLQELLKAAGVDLTSGHTVIAARTVIVSVVLGTLVTFVSALAPARRAATVPPIAALRDHPTAPSSGRRRFVLGAEFTGIGLIALVLALFGDIGGIPGGEAGLVGLAGALVFIGIAMLSPLVVQPAGRFLGWLPARFAGMSGVLARENSVRNPRRTASTAAALMVGLALVTLVATLGASLKHTIAASFSEDYLAEYTLNSGGFQPMSIEAAKAARDALPGGTVTEYRNIRVEFDGDGQDLLGADTNLAKTVNIHPRRGALERFRSPEGGLLIYKDAYDNLSAADRKNGFIDVKFSATGTQRIPIAGVFDVNGVLFGNNYLLSMPLYTSNVTDQQDVFISVKLPPGMSLSEGRTTLERALRDYPSIEVQNQSESQASFQGRVDQFLNFMYVLLLLSVLIALLGIVNALALSIFERTHEIGLLRAVGMGRPEVRRMVRYEAVIISVFGSLLGLVLGLVFGAAVVQALASDGIKFALPVAQVFIFLVLAGIAGLFAGWVPARRAARLDVLRAVQSEG